MVGRWAANAPIVMLPQYLPSLHGMSRIAIDIDNRDELLARDTWMHNELTRFGIAHDLTVFSGDHVDHVADRFAGQIMPFFGRRLQA